MKCSQTAWVAWDGPCTCTHNWSLSLPHTQGKLQIVVCPPNLWIFSALKWHNSLNTNDDFVCCVFPFFSPSVAYPKTCVSRHMCNISTRCITGKPSFLSPTHYMHALDTAGSGHKNTSCKGFKNLVDYLHYVFGWSHYCVELLSEVTCTYA